MSASTICGFTIVRNAVKFDYPIVESIKSILPIVDAYVVAVGNSDDDTMGLIQSINSPKIKIIETTWDDSLREGGRVLAVETNKALAAIPDEYDWCFYLQGDEVIHEKYHQTILDACAKYHNQKNVEGLLFGYTHFYGSYEYVGDSRGWYRNEIRIVRNDRGVQSFRDAQGFRINDRIMRVKKVNAQVYHYGWVRDPRFQQAKQESFNRLWHSDEYVAKHVATANEYDYKTIDSLTRFEGTHPAVMYERLKRMNWEFTWDTSHKRFKPKDAFLYWFEKKTGVRLFEYKNYKLL